MPVNYDTLNRELHELLRSRNYDPISLDSKGDPTDDVEESDVFRFHFKDEETGDKINAWATVEGNNLVLYIDDKFTEHKDFETFAHFLKRWSQRKLLGFDVSNKDRLLGDMKKRTVMNKKENMLEGYHPMGKKASYSDNVPEVKIILQHTRQIEEGEQRFRNIAKIFVENLEGERFLLPTNRPGLARVYARHIAEGGTPYDDKGRHITILVEEYSQMAGFVRATRNGQFNESALALVNEGLNHYNTLRMTLQGMASHRGYNKYFENYTPVLNEETDDDISLNELFVQETLDPRIENVMPILKRLSKNVTEMTAVKELDEWAESITEVEDETTKTLAEPADEMLDEAPGAETLKHNQDTEKSNLKAFDLDEEGIIDKVKKVGSKVFDKLGGGSEEDLLKDLQKKAGIPARAQHGKPNMAKPKDEEVDESALQAYLGDKKYGKDGMDALRKAGQEHASEKKMQNIRAKFSDKEKEVDEGVIGNMVNKAKSMFTKQAPAAAAAAPAAPVVPNAATQARMAAAPQGYDPNTGKPQVAAKAAPGAVQKGGTMQMTKKVVAPAAKPGGNYDTNTGAPISDKGKADAASMAAYNASPQGKAMDAYLDAQQAGTFKGTFKQWQQQQAQQPAVAEGQGQQLSIQQLATISDEALDNEYHYGRSQPGNSFGWQANLKSAAYAKQMIDKGVTDIEAISDAIHKGWNVTAQAFVQNPEQFDDTAKLKAAGELEAKLQQRAELIKKNYAQLPEDEKKKDRVVARALLQALKGGQDVEEGYVPINKYKGPTSPAPEPKKEVPQNNYDYVGANAQREKERIEREKPRVPIVFNVSGIDATGKVIQSGPLPNANAAEAFIKQHGIQRFAPTTDVVPTGGGPVAQQPAVAEDLDADQKRVGQLGPTEKVKNNNIGKLVGANESVEFKEGQDDLDAILRIVRK